MQSELEQQFEILWLDLFPDIDLVREYRAVPPRRYRWDYAAVEARVLIEINGGTWGRGGHSTGRGIQRDYEKLNLAIAAGWRQFNLSGDMIDAHWLGLIAGTIQGRGVLTFDRKNSLTVTRCDG
jgi:hypothetical protein